MSAPDLARLLAGVFATDAFYRALTPTETVPGRAGRLRTYFERALVKYSQLGEVQSDGEGQGVAIWEKSGAEVYAGPEPLAALTDVGRANAAAIAAFSRRMTVGAVPEAAWYLSILGVAEASQGRGIGARLLHVTLDRLDALGAPSYLETLNPRSVPFYERLGYRIWRSEIEPISGAQYWLMGRLAAQTSG